MTKATWGNIELTDECASNYTEKDKTKLLSYYRMSGWSPEQLLDCRLVHIIETSREKVIKWLRENTTREQWNNRGTLFFVGVNEPFTFDWETVTYDCAKGVCVIGCGKNKNAEPIHYQDVFEQPVFIDGAEYILHFIGHNGLNEKAFYRKGLNEFNGETGSNYPASYFGTKFTVELVTMGPTPEKPDPSAAPEAPVKPESLPVDRQHPRNKYDREIVPGVHVDVYDVLSAFTTGSPAIDHAVKKLLAPGQRGVKDRTTDLNEAISSIQREIDRIGEWSTSEDDE